MRAKTWEGKLASTFAEALPDECPPSAAVDEAIDEVYRLVANPTPTGADFESKAARGIPLGANATACSWASCSLSKNARSLLKYNRLRQELPYLARLTIPVGIGRHVVGGSRGHVDFWRYTNLCLSTHVVSVEGPSNG